MAHLYIYRISTLHVTVLLAQLANNRLVVYSVAHFISQCLLVGVTRKIIWATQNMTKPVGWVEGQDPYPKPVNPRGFSFA
jgi:hypothetical protein